MTAELFIVARAIQFAACLLFFGGFAFDRLVAAAVFARGNSAAAVSQRSHTRWLNLALPPLILISGQAWFVAVTMTMSSLPLGEALHREVMSMVWHQTQFGALWQIRSIFWLLSMGVAALSCNLQPVASLQSKLAWLQITLGGLLLGSLAWAGHGSEDSPWHLGADVLHLLVAGFWPAGLLPLLLLLRALRREPEVTRVPLTAALVRRFSALSLGCVGLLVVTGWVNAWFLVGSFSNLFAQAYGRWLLVKIILFVGTVAVGAVNLLRLKPRLASSSQSATKADAAPGQLYFNVRVELVLALAIVVVVAVLGILPPPFQP